MSRGWGSAHKGLRQGPYTERVGLRLGPCTQRGTEARALYRERGLGGGG